MPKIKATKATDAPKTYDEALQTVSDDPIGIKLALYGRGKTGKTRFACGRSKDEGFPKPLLLVALEDGTKSICSTKRTKRKLPLGGVLQELLVKGKPTGVDMIRIFQEEWMQDIMVEAPKYKSIVLDHGGALQDLVIRRVFGLNDEQMQMSRNMGPKKDRFALWGKVAEDTKRYLRDLLNLSELEGKDVVIITHERDFQDEDNTNSEEIVKPTVGMALTPSTATWLNGACDYVCQTFIKSEMMKKEIEVSGTKVEISEPTGKQEYCLRIAGHAVYFTGFRSLNDELPKYIANPTYKKMRELID